MPGNDLRAGDADMLARNDPDCNDSSIAGQIHDPETMWVTHAAQILSSCLQIDLNYQRFAAEVASRVAFDRMAIHVVDLSNHSETIMCVSGQTLPGTFDGDSRPLQGTEAQHVMMTGQSLLRSDLACNPKFCRDPEYMQMGLRSAIVVPVQIHFQFVGTLNLISTRSNAYGERERAILEQLAASIAPAVTNAQLYTRALEERERALSDLDQTQADRELLAQSLSLIREELGTLSHALNTCGSSVMIADRTAIVRYVNTGFIRLSGYGAEDVVGHPVGALSSGDEAGERYLRAIDVINTGEIWRGECRGRKKSGETFLSSRCMSPVRDSQGLVTYVVCVEDDISEWKLLQAKLLQAKRMEAVGYRVASVSHDFNNLLLAMLGFTALLGARLDPSSEAYEYSKMIESLANKGADLTHQLLNSNKEGPTQNNPIDLNGAILEVVRILEPILADDVTVDVELQEEIPAINGDVGQLQQAIMNLCLNAADAMPSGGRLGLSTESVRLGADFAHNEESVRPGPHVVLNIADTGVGISGEHLVQIFEPFFTTKANERGTGLGLSVVAGIVKDHGGVVRVSSTPGHGSNFIVYLPASHTLDTQELDFLKL